MEDHMQYIDDFFEGRLSPEELKVFESRVSTDAAFAEDVAFYVSARQSLKDMVIDEKKSRFKKLYNSGKGIQENARIGTVRRTRLVSLVAVAAAAVLVVVIILFNGQTQSTQQLANRYVDDNYRELSVTMGRADDLQRAVALYNEGKYAAALAAFERIMATDSSSFQATQYAGIAALRMSDYERALRYFRKLETFRAQYANPAILLQAIALLMRNQPGDKANAKPLLQKVIDDNLDGKATAEKLLKQLNKDD